MSADSSSTPPVFRCRADNARIIAVILSSLQSSSAKKDLQATCTIGRVAMKFTVEESRIYQANAVLREDLFTEYVWNQPNEQEQAVYRFRINLAFLLDCLNIFGPGTGTSTQHTTVDFLYAGQGHALLLRLEEGGVVTECALKTLDAEDLLDFDFRGFPIHNKVEMTDAEALKEVFSELDWNAQTVKLLISPEPPYFRASTTTMVGSFDAEYPKDSEVFEKFEVTRTQENTYKLALLQPMYKALAQALRSQLRMNEVGVLCFQHIIKAEDKTAFVDFYILPENSPDDE